MEVILVLSSAHSLLQTDDNMTHTSLFPLLYTGPEWVRSVAHITEVLTNATQ